MSPERGHILDRKKCTACGICAEHCPSNALEITGRVIEDDELVEKLSRDRLLYESSGGGVTFSGGEVLLHIDKLIRIAGRIREKGIHIAVDSAANVPWESIERSFPVIDLYLFDVKLLDPKKHQEYTGVNNKLILDNIKRTALVKPMYIRVPVIRGINDNDEEMCKIADYALSLGPNLKKLEFLTYHDLGKRKYTALGMEWRAFSAPVLDRMNQFKAFFEQKGILVSVS
jgi:pyruvate formate lyase activating enzyme